jgi:hypothetical protein
MAVRRGTGNGERRDKEQSLRTPVTGSLEDVGRSIAVRGHELRGIACRDLAGDMVYDVRSRASFPQSGLVVEIAAHEPDVGPPSQLPRQRRSPHQRSDGITACAQCLDQVRTDEAGASGHKNVHSGLS